MSQTISKTRAQVEALGNPLVGIQLYDGSKVFGRVQEFSRFTIYLVDRKGDDIDVPRRIIQRCLLLIDGGKEDE